MSTTRPPAYEDRATTPAEASRRGAHRARVKPVMAGLPVLAGLLVVAGVAAGGWAVLGTSGTDTSSASVQGAVPGDDGASPGAIPSAAGPTAAATSEASPAATQEPTASASPRTTQAATVDRGIQLVILNSVSVQGLAKRVSSNLQPDGWTVARTDNSIQKNLATTKIYYGSKANRVTAQALAKDLGFGTVVADQSVAKKGLVVVLGQDAV